jgi:hypothetical protein
MLFYGFLELLNTTYLPLNFKFDPVDKQFRFEQHLLIRADTLNFALQLIRSVVPVSDTPGGGFSPSIGWVDVEFHMFVNGYACRSLNLCSCSSHDLSNIFGKCASGTGCFSPNSL